uniref:Ig-like domain-containing protein n=1 Tax=Chelonoidis abingdonii TaxID=106734 RepID=A0A8C0GW94_CHEAB
SNLAAPWSTIRPVLIYFLCLLVHSTAQFKVVGPDHPVTAIVGEEIVLPCHLSPRMSAEKMEMTWFRSQISPFVHHYSDGKDQYGLQMPEFQGRTELLKDGLLNGSVALRILSIRPSDEGQYHCLVLDGIFYEEALLDLKVADPFFPRVNPWMVALSVILMVLLGSFALSAYLFWIKGNLRIRKYRVIHKRLSSKKLVQ